MTKLYVGNLPFGATDERLSDLFADFGPVVSAVVIKDKITGRSKGFGFVELEDDAKAQKAIDKLDGSEVEGRNIVVNPARPPRNS